MSVDDEAWLRGHLSALPRDVRPPERVAARIERRLSWRRRRRWLAPVMAVVVAGWWASSVLVEGPPDAALMSHRNVAQATSSDALLPLKSLDLELQAAYARGADDDELSALLAARVALVASRPDEAPRLRRL